MNRYHGLALAYPGGATAPQPAWLPQALEVRNE